MTRMSMVIAALTAIISGPVIGGLVSGVDRIVTARVQARVGPPILQPYYDVIKLFSKEKMVVNAWQAFCAYSYLAASVISLILFFLQSDMLVIYFIQAVGAVFLVVGALSSPSPFSQIGANRELLQILAYAPLMVMMIVGIAIEVGSFEIKSVYALDRPLLLKLPFLYLVAGYVLTIKLRKSPFDLSTSHHAHQELVKGLMTDFSGPFLGLIEIAHWYEMVLFLCFCSLFWATNPLYMVILLCATYFMEIVIDNVSARMTWRWMLGYAWSMALVLSFVNLVWVYQK